jgi:hypothetical protein
VGHALVALLAPYGPLAVYGVMGGALVVMAALFAAVVLTLGRAAIAPDARIGVGGAIGVSVLLLCTLIGWLIR